MTSTDNTDIFEQQIKHIRAALDMAKVVNMERNGRPDCKNCSLLEVIEEVLDGHQ